MLDFLELEETVGRAWHRLVGGAASYPRLSRPCRRACGGAADRSRSCSVRFGGEAGVQIAGAKAPQVGPSAGLAAAHRRLATRALDQPGRDAATLFLPDRIAMFPDRATQRLALSLAGGLVRACAGHDRSTSPIRSGEISWCSRRAQETVAAVLARFPGLVQSYTALCCRDCRSAAASPTAARRKGGGADRARPAGCRGAARRPLWSGRDRRGAAAATGPCRDISPSCHVRSGAIAGPARPRPSTQSDDERSPAPSDAAAGYAQALRGRGAKRTTPSAAIPSCSTGSRRSSRWRRWSMSTAPSDDSEDEDAEKAADDLERSHYEAAAASRQPSSNSTSTCRRKPSTLRG